MAHRLRWEVILARDAGGSPDPGTHILAPEARQRPDRRGNRHDHAGPVIAGLCNARGAAGTWAYITLKASF